MFECRIMVLAQVHVNETRHNRLSWNTDGSDQDQCNNLALAIASLSKYEW